MSSQLRIYRIKPGTMDAFVALWREHLVPARAAYGFRVVGAWITQDGGEFAWVVAHEGPGTFEEADARYYDSPERAGVPQSPAGFIEDMDLRMMEPVAL
jgi:hypothetical protein